jgi:hypothetical protein
MRRRRLLAPVKRHSYPSNMRGHLDIGPCVVVKQAEGVRQKQVSQFVLDPTKQTPIEPLAVEREVDVGALLGGALGPRPEKHSLPDLGKMRQHVLNHAAKSMTPFRFAAVRVRPEAADPR